MPSTHLNNIHIPTLILDETKAKKNLKKMAAKAAAQNIRFRPHFKTHQSAQVGECFRAEGVASITVSSLSMAQYFAEHGWQDILVAFPVNLREMETINDLAARISLSLLVESVEIASQLEKNLNAPVNVWIKIDTGYHRTGIDVKDADRVRSLARNINDSEKLHLRGLLTHAGHTYHAHSTEEIIAAYAESSQTLQDLRLELEQGGFAGLELSVGDTPGCWLSSDLGQVDEIRPGNFIFFDAMMFELGVCSVEEIALAVACPVVAIHPQRNEVVIYGGAVHLSKDSIVKNRETIYGYVAFPTENGWEFTSSENYISALSQEHGIVRLTKTDLKRVKVGDLIYVLPAHSCLAVDALGEYLTLQGERITTMLSCAQTDLD